MKRIEKHEIMQQYSQVNAFPAEVIFEAFPDMLFLLDTDGRIINHKIGRNFSTFFPGKKFTAKSLQDVFSKAAGMKISKALKYINTSGKKTSTEFKTILNNNELWLEVQLTPANEGRIVAIIGTKKPGTEAAHSQEDFVAAFKSFSSNSPQFTGLLKADGTLLHANNTALDFGGIAEEEVLHKPLWDAHWWQNSEEVKLKVKQVIHEAAKDMFSNFEAEIQGNDNKKTILDFSLKPVKNNKGELIYLIPEGIDITSKKITEQARILKEKQLSTAQLLCKSILAGFPKSCIFIFNQDLEFTFAGGAMLEECGLIKSEIEGKKVEDFLSEMESAEILPAFTSALRGGFSQEVKKWSKNGKHFSINISAVYNNKSHITEGIVVAFDIENQKQAEIQLEKKIAELLQINERLSQEIKIKRFIETNLKHQSAELKRKNQELEQFAYVASHDLQEPLRMVSSFAQLLAKRYNGRLDETADEFIRFTVEGAQRMQILINDLLSYSRIGIKAKPFNNVDVKQVMKNALNNLSIRIDETGADIIFGNLPDQVKGDDTQLTQLFQNLISNALKFKREQLRPSVYINATELPAHYLFSVEDNGIGINMEHKERIFQIFQRLHTRDKYPGTGIGLAVCKKIVERHEGEIWVESENEKGTKFYFTIKKQLL